MVQKIFIFLFLPIVLMAVEIQNPTRFLGVDVGADRALIGWEEIQRYFNYVGVSSDRVVIEHLGKTTLGRDLIMAIISDAQNIGRLTEIRNNQQTLALDRNLSDTEQARLISETPVILFVTFNIHSTEIGSSQAAVELLYELATNTQFALHNVLVLLVPSVNPDGQQMVTDWYRKYVNTSYEGAPMPQLYHYYAGHDNNRDWHFFNLQESQLLADVLYHDWYPEVVYDQHQMGSRGPRIFLPPYADPVNPMIPPSLTAQLNFMGEKVVSDLHNEGFQGIVTGTIFNAYFQGTLSKTPLWHNRIGILCEIASARIATPLFFPFGSLNSFGPDLPEYKTQTNFLDPWPGGWWRLRHIMDLEKEVFYSILDFASTYHDRLKQQFVRLNLENIKRGMTESPFGYFIPTKQRDLYVMREMLQKLHRAGVKIDTLTRGLNQFEKGTFYISCAQPERNYIIDLFQIHHYPELRLYPEGPPIEPYDVTTWNMPLQMGVDVFEDVTGNFPDRAPIEHQEDISFKGKQYGSGNFVLFNPGTNWSVSMALKLADQGKEIWQAMEQFRIDGEKFPAGTFIADTKGEAVDICAMLNAKVIDTYQSPDLPKVKISPVGRTKIGLYQPLYPSMDEGWTRWVLDQYGFSYRIIDTKQLVNDKLDKKIGVLIIPSLRREVLEKGMKAYYEKDQKIADIKIPPEYTLGLGKSGMAHIRTFVNGGGRLILLHQSITYFADSLGLPVSVLNNKLPRDKFYIPGALLRLKLDPNHYLSFGMPAETDVYYDSQGPVLKLLPYTREVATPGIFPEHDILRSGWALGEEWLQNRVGLADIPVGEGHVVLIGFRPQHRGQTYGTFGFLFNTLIP